MLPLINPKSILACLLLVGATFFFQFSQESSSWSVQNNAIPLDVNNWKILLDSNRPSCQDSPQTCSQPPSQIELSQAPLLGKSEYRKRLRRGDMGSYWLVQEVEASNSLHQPYLALGKSMAHLEIWINQSKWLNLNPQRRKNHLIPLPQNLVGQKIEIGIRVLKGDAPNSLLLMDQLKEGILDPESALGLERFLGFANQTKPFTLFTIYFLLSALFLFTWVLNPQAKEYGSLSLLALVNAIPELLFGESLPTPLPDPWRVNVLLLIMAAKTSLIFHLSLSFCRLNGLKKWSSLPILISLPLLFTADFYFLGETRAIIIKWIVSFSMIFGGIIAFLHQRKLTSDKSSMVVPRQRLFRIQGYFAISSFIGLAHFAQFLPTLSLTQREMLWGIPELGYVIFIGCLAAIDFKKQKLLIENTPVSEYHKRAKLPDFVEGVLLTLDIKNSERLFKMQEALGRPIVALVIEAAWKSLDQAGAAILRAEGDEIIAFFDRNKFPQPWQAALSICEKTVLQLNSAESSPIGEAIHVRTALVPGRVTPVWVGEGKNRQPSWTQAADSQVFVDSARLLELEKGLEGSKDRSQLVVPAQFLDEMSPHLFGLSVKIYRPQLSVLGKHNREYRLTQLYWQTTETNSEKKLAS